MNSSSRLCTTLLAYTVNLKKYELLRRRKALTDCIHISIIIRCDKLDNKRTIIIIIRTNRDEYENKLLQACTYMQTHILLYKLKLEML